MNWDCSIIIRSSTEETSTTANFKQLIQRVNTAKRSGQAKTPANDQGDKSRETKKKMSLKSKNSSMTKREQECSQGGTDKFYQFKHERSDQLENRRRKDGRIQTQPNVSYFSPTFATETMYSNTSTNCKQNYPYMLIPSSESAKNIQFRVPSVNKANISCAHYSQGNPVYQPVKVASFCPTTTTTTTTSARTWQPQTMPTRYNNTVLNQFIKRKPVVKFSNNEKPQPSQNHSVINFKNMGQQKEKKSAAKGEKENNSHTTNTNTNANTKQISSFNEQSRIESSRKTHKIQEGQDRDKKRKFNKIQDFLSSKIDTKSVSDSDELSSQYSRVIFSYGHLLAAAHTEDPDPNEIHEQ